MMNNILFYRFQMKMKSLTPYEKSPVEQETLLLSKIRRSLEGLDDPYKEKFRFRSTEGNNQQ